MKYLCKRLAAGCLALAMLAGCAPAAPAPSPAVGGYRETEITPDDSLENATICTDEEGRLHLFSTDAAYGELPEFVQHTVYADDEWQHQPADWAGQLAELCPAPDADGLYSITFGVEQADVWVAVSFTASNGPMAETAPDPADNRLWLFRTQDGALTGGEVDLGGGNFSNLLFSSAIQTGETLLLPTLSESLVVSRDGRLLDHRDALSSALQTDGVLVQDHTGALLQCPKDGTPAEVNWSNPGSDPLTMTSRDGTAYFVCSTGFYRAQGGTLEQLAEGDRLRVGRPGQQVRGLAVAQDNIFYLCANDRIYRYEYDPALPAVTEQITVFSLRQNYLIQEAVGRLAVEQPELGIDYQYVLPVGSGYGLYLNEEFLLSTYEDAVRSLYTSIAAGNGPDVLILDDLDPRSLMQQGMLEDLSGLVDTSSILPAVRDAFSVDGKQYAAPARFYPWVVGSWGEMPPMDDFDSLRDAILAGKAGGEYTDPETGFSSVRGLALSIQTHNDLFAILYPAWQQKLTADPSAAQEFLEQGQQLAQHMGLTAKDVWTRNTRGISFTQPFSEKDHTELFCDSVLYPDGLTVRFLFYEEPDVVQDGHLALLRDTQGLAVCYPGTAAAIPANSAHKEAAAEFIRFLLSEPMQQYGKTASESYMEGVASVPSAWDSLFEGWDKADSFADGISYLKDDPAALLENVEQCLLPDPALEARVEEIAVECWIGKRTLEQASSDLAELLQTMQAERK